MEKNCKGETAQKSIAEMENEVKDFNEKLKPIQEWFNAEKRKRLRIAQSSSEHDNTICPICGKKLSDDDCNNGLPLVDACVCGDCDKRYVYPFRLRSGQVPNKELNNMSWQKYLICMQAELLIETTNKIKSLNTNHSDVA